MKKPVRTVGNYLSPYVRKVLVVLDLKNIPYEIDPIIPIFGDDRFTAISPLRRIPVLIDEQATLCDSSIICQYLEERYPEPALYPQDLVLRARARWLEEFADTQMGMGLSGTCSTRSRSGPSYSARPRTRKSCSER